MKKLICSILVLLLILALGSCSEKTKYTLSGDTTEAVSTGTDGTAEAPPAEYDFSDFDKKDSWEDDAVTVAFNTDSAKISGNGAALSGTVLTVFAKGTYVLSGEFNGEVIVSVPKTDKVQLVLNGAGIYSDSSSAIYIASADKVSITLAEGTENSVSDGYSYASEDGAEPNSCIYSKDDLTINGSGSLSVRGNSRNGITSKDDLRIVNGNITVSACKNALKGKDSVSVGGGNITVKASVDAIKSDNSNDTSKGYILITGGFLDLTCDDDALQSVTSVTVTGGSVTVAAGDNPVNCDGNVSIADGCLTEK